MSSALSTASVLASGHHPVVNELPFPPIVFGVIAIVLFLLLLALLWGFRNTLALDPHGHAVESDPDTGRSH